MFLFYIIYMQQQLIKQEATNLEEHQEGDYGNAQRRKGRGKWCKHIVISKIKIVFFKNHKNVEHLPILHKTLELMASTKNNNKVCVTLNSQTYKMEQPSGPLGGPFHAQPQSFGRWLRFRLKTDPSAGWLRGIAISTRPRWVQPSQYPGINISKY